jgi:hypothetical protein
VRLKNFGSPRFESIESRHKKHVAEHKQADYGLAFDSLEEFLTEQVLMVASKKTAKCKLVVEQSAKAFHELGV